MNGKKWWVITPLLTIAGIVFGAGGMACNTRASLQRQDKCIEQLMARSMAMEVAHGRMDERLKAISCQLQEIRDLIRVHASE